jgi:signal peptidase I
MSRKIIFIIFLAGISLFLFFFYNFDSGEEIIEKESCPVILKEVSVNGSSMVPFLNPEDRVTAIYDYYNCHDVLRNDVVLYKYSGNSNLLIKFIKAVPGDKWKLKEADNGYEIVVNDISLLNSKGSMYLIPENSVRMLELYVNDYPIIPKDTYLLLGDKIDGSLDSTSFGLVGKKDIMAKVER